jgi:threonyl-tRNA synthetase
VVAVSLKVHEKIHEKMRELGNEYVSLYNLTRSFFEGNRDFFKKMAKAETNPVLLHFVPEKKYYWVINVEYHITDELKRSREIATVQIDMGNAKRFGIKYVNEKREEIHPPILHIAILGGIERYLFTVFDTALKLDPPRLPLWLAPIQVRVIPVSDSFLNEADKIADEIERNGIRVDVDDRALTLPKKVREAGTEWINYVLVIGQKEMDSGTLSVRDRKAREIRKMQLQKFIDEVEEKTKNMPFKPLTLPRRLSERPRFFK